METPTAAVPTMAIISPQPSLEELRASLEKCKEDLSTNIRGQTHGNPCLLIDTWTRNNRQTEKVRDTVCIF